MSFSETAHTSTAAIISDPRWAAVLGRDRSADYTFVYAVSSTGVYCRPSCAARLAKPEHVSFHPTSIAAEAAGFRPCKRCRPHEPSLAERQTVAVAETCRFIERSEQAPSLKALAEAAGMSPHHFHRVFKAITGLTPRGYAAALRAREVRRELVQAGSVTEAIYRVGFKSSGPFYASAEAMLGMTPSAFRSGAAAVEIRYAIGKCSLGSILVARSNRGVCAILLGDDPSALITDLRIRFPRAKLLAGDREFIETVASVVAFVERPVNSFPLPLDIRGTAFQQRVWQALREIRSGQKVSYTELAQSIGLPRATRAVARACAANPLAVAVPCHRVVRADGSLSGYRWGVERKRTLLQREAQQ